MIKIIIGVIVAVVLSIAASVLVVHSSGPSTADLDRDLAAVRAEITSAEADAAKYSGGLIFAEVQLRVATLKNTFAMLEEKRTSFLRGIALSYRDNMVRNPIDADAESRLDAELAKADADALAAEADAARYSGGLIQTMDLVRAATSRMTAATVEQQRVLGRYGIPLPAVAPTAGQGSAPTPSVGAKTTDKDALR